MSRIVPYGREVGDGDKSLNDSLRAAREEYAAGGLVESDLASDPIAMFQRWYDDAKVAGIHEPNAMVVATATPDGVPSSRFVLLKGVSDEGFVFYTNTLSRKGRELAANPSVALLFPWHPLERQVRVDGTATLLGRDAVADYFAVREALAAAYDEVEARYAGQDVPVPEEWGGYLVCPEAVEFWQGRPGRMHDRLVYSRDGHGWTTERLAP
jgi:pyridoxamine 5'-phosphate oxidase